MLHVLLVTASYVGAFVLGVASNVIAAPIIERRRESTRRHRIARAERKALVYQPESDGLIRVCGWSGNRPLEEGRLHVHLSSTRPDITWVDRDLWEAAYRTLEQGSAVGECGYVTGWEGVDFREGPRTDDFTLTLSRCDYAEGIATATALWQQPAAQAVVEEALQRRPDDFIRTAPPSPLAASIAVMSHDRSRFLAVRRSATVATARSLWSVGIYETLSLRSAPGMAPENLFQLVRRGLREELNLFESDYSPVFISWFGFYAKDAHPWIFAQVRTHLADKELLERRANAHSADEASTAIWLPLDLDVVRAISDGLRTPRVEATVSAPSVRVDEIVSANEWIIHAPHAMNELWRVRSAL